MQFDQPVLESESLTLVPRVKSFANQYVTKSAYSENETKISSLSVLVFNSDGKLLHIEESSDLSSVTLNKSMLDSPAQAENLASATVVMIANISLDDIKKSDGTSINDNKASLTLADMENYSCDLTNYATVVTDLTSDSFTGFPMIGGVKNVDLRPTSTQQKAIEVGLKILYAKVNFSIAVENGTENQNVGSGISFALSGYSVHNVSGATTLAIPTEEGEKVSDFLGYVAEDAVEATADEATDSAIYTYADGTGFSGTASGNTTVGGSAIPFTFYIAESRYNHNSALTGIYPDDSWLADSETEDVKNYTSADQDKLNGVKYFYDDLIQQYKPKLAANSPDGLPDAGLATYVQINGTYTDYRGTAWDVNYKVYLGKDNAQNFHVDRNSEYTNHITIKGIRNNDSYGEGQVWVDHRVNVNLPEDSSPGADCITITRETLIDSHFEVRPLRVNLPDTVGRVLLYLPKYNGSQITETEDDVLQNWIAVENNNGRVRDITKYSQNGKRKYFTTSLIKELYLDNNDEKYGIKVNSNINDDSRAGQQYISLFDGDCAWIYIDENASTEERTANIDLVFYDTLGNVMSAEIFKLIQNGLEEVGGYYIEKYEEYLHTYDSQDLYTDPLTDYTQKGYKWGLEGIQLSNSQSVTTLSSANDDYRYDYFHAIDQQNVKGISDASYNVLGIDNIAKNIGLNFTNNAGVSQEMTIIDMDTRPSSAIQYCLSKNKFRIDDSDEEAHTMDIHWYLPDTYEMTTILNSGNEEYPDFEEYAYWTSQPSWTTLTSLYLHEDTDNARVVSIDAMNTITDGSVYQGTNTSRTEQNRIRCVYSPEGIDGVDFSGNRAPDGIGPMRFYMRAWKDWDTKEPGYFSWEGCLEDTETPEVIEYQLPDTYDFPKDADDANQYFGAFLEGYGFEEDPSDKQNWDTETVRYLYTSQVALNKWPGLTTSQVVTKNTITGGETYYDLEGEKKETKGTITTYATDYTDDITTSTLKHLDHLVDGTDLSINFSKGDGTSAPIFDYYKENSIISKTITRSWVTPTYHGNGKVESEEKGPIYTPSGTVILTADEEATRIKRGGTLLTNEDGYIYPTEADAIEAGNAIVPSGAYNTTVVAEKSPTSLLGDIELYSYKGTLITRYYRAARYRYKVTYTLDGQTVTYYQYDNGGYWSEEPEKTVTTENNDPPTDQLIMYGGNSFTITANNNNEISSVKIYYSGSNVVDVVGEGHDYLRFTKDGFTGGKDEVPPGMTYSANGETGTMTWNGDPLTEVTFQLVLYRDAYGNIFGWGDPTSFSYIANTDDSKGESIVIDQIDVRYKKKSTSSTE